jgi:predicted RNA binding protein YcfA (HicA-like mRNA interferase family)
MKLPILSARKVIRIFEKEGFHILRQKGSHISLYKKTEKKTLLVVVPNKKEIKIGPSLES